MSKGKTKGDSEKEPFWGTLQVKITAITGVVLVLAGLFVGLGKLGESIGGFTRSIASLTGRREPKLPLAKYCSVIPLSLKHSIGTQELQNLLYWFYFEVENNTEESMHPTVTFTIVVGPAVSDMSDENEKNEKRVQPLDSVAPGCTGKQRVDPFIYFTETDYDEPADLVLSWTIKKRHSGTIIGQGKSDKIELLPRTMIDWDLRTPEGKPVSSRFMLAWLTAWVITAEKETRNLSEELWHKINFDLPVESQARQWMGVCYSRLFTGAARVVVRPSSQPLPGIRRQTIETAESLLAARSADPLEAALLMAGVSRGFLSMLPADLALFGLPLDQDTGSDRILLLLGWRRPPAGAWHAVEITRASQLDFDANEEEATRSLHTLLSSQKELVQVLDVEGSFVSPEASAAAVHLVKPQPRFHIRGLP